MRLTTDLFAYCAERLPQLEHDLDLGYHIREAGSTAVQELAFTLANGIAYAQAAVDAGLSPDEFGARLSFFFNAHNHFFQEVAKFRAARRLWARDHARALRRDEPEGAGAALPRADRRLDADRAAAREQHRARRDPGALGGLRRRAVDPHELRSTRRWRCRPSTRRGSRCARSRSSPHETGVTDTADPLGGSYFVEALTDELEARARELIERIDELGGAVAAIEQGFVQREIEEAAYRYQQAGRGRRARDRRRQPLRGGRSRSRSSCTASTPRSSGASSSARRACAPSGTPAAAEAALARGARGGRAATENLLPPMREALRARCTIGEICDVLRDEFGMYDAQRAP